MVVAVAPAVQHPAGVGETVEDLLVEAFVTKPAIEALDEAVLLGLARRDIVPGDPSLVLPFQDGPAGQFGPVVLTQPRDPGRELVESVRLSFWFDMGGQGPVSGAPA